MPSEATGAQLAQLLDRQATMAGDIRVIMTRMESLGDHEGRLRSLEATRSRLWAIWGGAVVLGAGIGWLLAFVTRVR
jgi:hypothetical protein